jgi:hypothetical protein
MTVLVLVLELVMWIMMNKLLDCCRKRKICRHAPPEIPRGAWPLPCVYRRRNRATGP